ncbi:MAG TPA: hypothetical protein PKI62_05245 [bacterium]|nr:hypothetical protein [bacterium]HPR87366.1 hypothetical protein [bacterium]
MNGIWLAVTLLPHAPVHFLSWANHSLYTLLLLLAIAIARRDRYKKMVFISLACYFFTLLLAVVPIFAGKNYLFGTNPQCILLWLYAQIPVRFFGALTVFFLVIHYTVPVRWHRTAHILATLLSLGAAVFLFEPFWSTTRCIDQAGWLNSFIRRMLPFSILPVVALMIYGLQSFRHNRPDAIYINFLAFQLFFIHFLNIADYIAYTEKIKVYGIDQYFLLGCLIALVMILILRLGALYSEKERFYERVIFDPAYLSRVPVLFYNRTLLRWWPLLRDLLNRSLLIHFCAGLVYLALALVSGSLYTTLKLTLLILWIGILIVLVEQKYAKSQAGTILNEPKLSTAAINPNDHVGASTAAP